MCALGMQAAVEAYACYTPANTTLTFYCDNLRSSREGTTYDLNTDTNKPGWYTDHSYAYLNKVVIDESFANARPTSTYYWFAFMYQMTSLTGLQYLNTSEVTNMSYMFSSSSLDSLDLSHFDTGRVTDMSAMFMNSYLTALDLSTFNTMNVTNMANMFGDCGDLKSIDLSSFDTRNVTNMESMFYECTELDSLDLSNFNTSNVTNMSSMFYDCCTLTDLDLSSFDTHNVTNMEGMFNDCNLLTHLDLGSFNTSNVTHMGTMFGNCSSLTSIDLSSFDTHNVTAMNYMFVDCSRMRTIYVNQDWSNAAVTSSENMFRNCTSIVGGQGTTYDADHIDAAYAHIDGGPSNPGYFSAKNAFLRGDVDGDTHVDINDVTKLIGIVLGTTTTDYNAAAADCDVAGGSGSVDINDVTALLNFVLNGHWN